MKTGITGLPFSGKTTLFCALTGQDYDSLGHGRDIHMGTVKVPDDRLEKLFEMIRPKKITHATMEFFDIAGQSGGSDKTIESKALQAMKNAESLIVVLDAFNPGADPERDFNSLMDEFVFNDLVVVTNRLERVKKDLKSVRRDDLVREHDILETCRDILEGGEGLRGRSFDHGEEKILRGFQLITLKSLLIVVNIPEDALSNDVGKKYEALFGNVKNALCASICCEIEKEIAMLDEADRPTFLESMGIREPALGRLIRMSYLNLGLISFFTGGGPDEVRAWTVRKGSNAQECAGAIHSDMERGFIRAETVAFDDFVKAGSFKNAREQGLLRIEGKEYIVQDGDILTMRFSV